MTVYCAVLAEKDSAEAIASVLLRAVERQHDKQQTPFRAMVLKSNIARIAPSLSLHSNDGIRWRAAGVSSIQHGGEDAHYYGALMLTLAACGLTFRPFAGEAICFTQKTQNKFDGLYLDLIFDSNDEMASRDKSVCNKT